MGKSVVVLQSNYLPWKGYFDLIHDADYFVYYDEVQYTKNDWRNRNRLKSRSGTFWLTVPVSKGSVKGSIDAVELTQHQWQIKHFKSVQTAYGSSAYFNELAEFLESFYINHTWKSLVSMNRYGIEYFARRLGCDAEFIDSRKLELRGNRVERLVDAVVKLGGDHYISGPAASDYLGDYLSLFNDKGIGVTFKKYDGYPVYKQAGQSFEHGVSIIDLIAQLGFEKAAWHIWGWRHSG